MHPNYTVKNPKLLYIDRYGYFYPDCKTYKTPVIGHILEDGIVEKVLQTVFSKEEEPLFHMITVEVSSACHAKCFYCFQEDGKRGEPYLYYNRLMEILLQLHTYWLFFSGGEILDQKDAMEFMEAYRKADPDTWIHLKTNGNANLDRLPFVDRCCNSVMVSFNGFTDSSCRTLMDVELGKTIAFCEAVQNQTKTNLCVKFLNSPVCVEELPAFLEWAIEKKRQKPLQCRPFTNMDLERTGKAAGDSMCLKD